MFYENSNVLHFTAPKGQSHGGTRVGRGLQMARSQFRSVPDHGLPPSLV